MGTQAISPVIVISNEIREKGRQWHKIDVVLRIICICYGREDETVPRGPGGLGKLERERAHEAQV